MSAAGRVVVAMSGGVDSSVAAALLRDEGYEVLGVTLKLQDCHEARESRSCCGVDGITRARAVAGQLGIRHYVLDCVREFEELVLRPAWDEYASGRTPSPCLLCNERIKFGLLLAWSRQLGASVLATGHYARIESAAPGEPNLLRGTDPEKDQSYFLAGLDRAQLSSVCFPIGHLTKAAVRERGRSLGLVTAETHDSQDACLVGPGQSFPEMLRERFAGESKPGLVVDEEGNVLGQHPGVHQFTIGQRRGIHVPSTTRRFVKEIRARDSTVVVTDKEEELLSEELIATGMSFFMPPGEHRECAAQIRYRHAPEPAVLATREDGAAVVSFRRPVRAITPGQAVVLFEGTKVLGKGWIHARG